MNKSEVQLDQIEATYIDGKRLSAAQIRIASKVIRQSNERDVLTGCVALLCDRRCTTKQKQRAIARRRFDELCVSSVNCDRPPLIDILFSLLQIPHFELRRRSSAFVELAHKSLLFGRESVRTNAIVVLERLAKYGNQRALALIWSALSDPSETVQCNAQVALRNLAGGGNRKSN